MHMDEHPTDADACLLCTAERVTVWHFEDEQCWIADCMVCGTPMIVWRTHGLPEPELEGRLLRRLSAVASIRYPEGYWLDGERRRIPGHWHAHARPAGGFFDPSKPEPWVRQGDQPEDEPPDEPVS
jgi:hypothetical protein